MGSEAFEELTSGIQDFSREIFVVGLRTSSYKETSQNNKIFS